MFARLLVATLILLATPLGAEAQQARKVWRIGFLSIGSPPSAGATSLGHTHEAFRQGLRDHGWEEGKNIILEIRYAEGHLDRLPGLAAELVAIPVDLIAAATTPAGVAAKRATTTIPIVMTVSGDLVEHGLVASLARPGGNVTGLTQLSPELSPKRLELLKELGRVARVAVLWNATNTEAARAFKETQDAAGRLRMTLHSIEVRGPSDLEPAFRSATASGMDAVIVLNDGMLLSNRARIVEFANTRRIPAMYPWSDAVRVGGLMSYGPNLLELHRRAATYVDKILKGARPAYLPIEQPTKFELVINLKTAKALGLTIPQSLLLRADQVIE